MQCSVYVVPCLSSICTCVNDSICAYFLSLRALYGMDLIRNAVHGSSSRKEANREISFFFPSGIMQFSSLNGKRVEDWDIYL